MLQEMTCAVPKRALIRDDDSLVRRSIEGDHAAFDTLVHRYNRMVMGVLRRFPLRTEDAEDLTQQAFMKAFINISRFRFDCSFSSWLVSIALNEARMWSRKHRRSREVQMIGTAMEGNHIPALDFPDHRQNPERELWEREQRDLLRNALGDLPPIKRNAIRICDLEQLSMLETAVCLGITVSALKSRRSRGRADLRRRLTSRLFRTSIQPG